MEKSEKRIYLTLENQKEIVRAFFIEWKGKKFGKTEFKVFLTDHYDWFKKASQSIQDYRLDCLISVMKSMYKNLEKVSGGIGVKSMWLLPVVATEVESKDKEKAKPKRIKCHCSTTRITAFYNIAKLASKPGGITKIDVATIMGYQNKNVSTQGIESLNNLFELETSTRPIKIDKSHKFINLDTVYVDPAEASLIMKNLLEKLGGVEPKEPEEILYKKLVKPILKSDYYTLKMFEEKQRLEYCKGDAAKFRKSVMDGCNVTIIGNRNSMENVVLSFMESLSNRYKIEILMDVKPRQYIQMTSSQEELKEALKIIEDKYAEFFCDDIVPHEKTVLASEIKKEKEPNTEEEDVITLVESVIFKNESGNLFISEIWKKLDSIHVERHWDILGVLRKCPRFSVKNKNGESGIEPCVYYTAPEPISTKEAEDEEGKDLKEEDIKVIEDDFKPSPKNGSSTTEVYFGFHSESDLNEICQKAPCERIDDDGAYHMLVFYADNDMDKKTKLLLLKLCYMAMSSEQVKMIYHNKNLLIRKLEYDLLN